MTIRSHKFTRQRQKAARSLCEEAKTLAQMYLDFESECDETLSDLQYNFEHMHDLMNKDHFAQLISRNGVAVLASKRGVSVGEKFAFMDQGSSNGRALEFEDFDRALGQATIRLNNAARKAEDTLSSSGFQEKSIKASKALASNCVQACKNTIKHAKFMLSLFVGPNLKDQMESEFLGSEIDTVMGHPSNFKCEGHDRTLEDQLKSLINQVTGKQRVWTRPIDEIRKLWGDAKLMYERDQEANRAMLDWSANDIVNERNKVSTWIHEMELTIFAQNNETQQVEFTQHREMTALTSGENPHNVDGTSKNSLVTANDEMVVALSKAEMDVGMNTVAVISAYRAYVESARDVFAAAVHGSVDEAQDATNMLHVAASKVDEVVMKSNSVVEEAASSAARWDSPDIPLDNTEISVSTARESSKAPKNAFGDFALKLQHARSVSDVEATAAQAGDTLKRKHAEADLRVARAKLRESVKKMLNTPAPSENPSKEHVEALKGMMNLENDKSMAMRRDIDKTREEIPDAPPVNGGSEEDILVGTKRLGRIQRDIERLSKLDAIAPMEHQYIQQTIRSDEAEDKYLIAKKRYEENQIPSSSSS